MALTLKMKAPQPSKCLEPFTQQYSITSQETRVFRNAALRAANLTVLCAVALTLVVYSSASPFELVSSCLLSYIIFHIKCLIIMISEIDSGGG